MRILCPRCSQALAAADVNVRQNLAFCRACNEGFSLGALGANEPARMAAPAGTRVLLLREPQRLAIQLPATGRKGAGCFMLIFSVFWNVVTWIMLIASFFVPVQGPGSPISGLSDRAFFMLFMTPFVLIGIATALLTLFLFLGESSFAVDRSEGLLRRSLFGVEWNRRFKVADISDIRRISSYEQNDQPVYGVGLEMSSGRNLVFGASLSEDEKSWLIGELGSFWKEGR